MTHDDLDVEAVPGPGRRWRLLAIVGFVLAIYLALWIAYTANGLTDFQRYRQLAPGASGSAAGFTFRVVQLQQSAVLADQEDGSTPRAAAPNAVWVVVELEVTRQSAESEAYCTVSLLGPQRRVWPATSAYSGRKLDKSCSAEDLPVGAPTRLEMIYEVPTRYLDQLAGLVLVDPGATGATPVIRPA